MMRCGWVVAGLLGCASGFFVTRTSSSRNLVLLSDKGFGSTSKPKGKKKEKQPTGRLRTETSVDNLSSDREASSPLLQQLLEQERQRQEVLEREMADLKERDAYVRSTSDAGRLPEVVANRMAVRMAVFGGVPTFGGIALFVFFYLSATNDVVFQPTAVAAATTAPWIVGLLGIGYGALSASWDEDADGSMLGASEFKTNVQRILEGLRRSAKDAKLRDSMQKEKTRDS